METDKTLFVTAPLEVKFAGEAGSFTGYASTFGGEPDTYRDLVQPGAFRKSLARFRAEGTTPPMLWNHDQSEVIGRWNVLTEDAQGLRVEGQLDMNVTRAREAYSLLKGKAVSGLSIGFMLPPDGRKFNADGTRTLIEVDLAEISVVAIPANRRAKITDVKSVSSLRDFEHFLRDHGFARGAAAKLAKHGWHSLSDTADDQHLINEMTASLKAATQTIKKG